MPTWSSFLLMDAMSPLMEYLNLFHDYTMLFLISILMIISYTMIMIMNNKFINKTLRRGWKGVETTLK